MNRNQNCDGSHCRHENGTVQRMALPGNAGLMLCSACWAHENHWRQLRNAELAPDCQFPIIAWPQQVAA